MAKDLWNARNIASVDKVSMLTLISIKLSGAGYDEIFFVGGRAHVSRTFGGSVLLSQRMHFDLLREKRSGKGETERERAGKEIFASGRRKRTVAWLIKDTDK